LKLTPQKCCASPNTLTSLSVDRNTFRYSEYSRAEHEASAHPLLNRKYFSKSENPLKTTCMSLCCYLLEVTTVDIVIDIVTK